MCSEASPGCGLTLCVSQGSTLFVSNQCPPSPPRPAPARPPLAAMFPTEARRPLSDQCVSPTCVLCTILPTIVLAGRAALRVAPPTARSSAGGQSDSRHSTTVRSTNMTCRPPRRLVGHSAPPRRAAPAINGADVRSGAGPSGEMRLGQL